MPVWVSNLIIVLLTRLTSWLFAKGLEKLHGAKQKESTERDIDERLKLFKQAYKEAFNGESITPEQRKKLNQSIADFLRGSNTGGL